MIVIGLTGSIAMGKSETARMFRNLGIPVFDADAVVHEMYAAGGEAVESILERYPEARSSNGGIDRAVLAGRATSNPAVLAELEAIVHPLVEKRRRDFLRRVLDKGSDLVVIDHPLLLEKGGDRAVDVVVVVSAPEAVQRQRALARPGMTAEKLEMILSRQLPDRDKRARADYIIDTSLGLSAAALRVRAIVDALRRRKA
jgi:dephospho-CoA kinase